LSVAFIAVRKDQNGKITHFMTDQEEIITFEQARELVRNGQVDSLTEIYADGSWEMNLDSSSAKGNNLDDLPLF
jgi:hypothetical protein